MALNTATDLTAALQAFLEDDDTEFQASIPDVLNLGELRLLRDLDLAIFRRTDSSLTMTASQALDTKPTIASPDLLVATKEIYLTGGSLTRPRFLVQRSMEYVLDYNSGTDATPRYFGEVDETQWIWGPTPDATYTVNLRYLSRPDPLVVTSNETNWLSNYVSDILFKACLAEAEKFLLDEERAPVWDKDYMEALPRARRELYNQFGNQFDNLGAVSVPQAPRSVA